MNVAKFFFHPDFDPFLEKEYRRKSFDYAFDPGQSVKHLVEALGVPHTEIHHILINGKPVKFSYQVQDADFVDIFPYSAPHHYPPMISSKESGEVECNHCFVLDNHLGKLASYLRLMGFDCLYRNDYQDEELAQVSHDENRILLTRDQHLLMRNAVLRGYWVHSKIPRQQVQEVLDRFNLYDSIQPFRRCAKCNSVLAPVSKDKILNRLEPLTRRYFNEFRICPSCKQIYWKGSHYKKILTFIDEISNGSNHLIRDS